VFKAQTVIVVQNNQWAISVPRSRQTASPTLAQKGLAFGVESVVVDGNDALAMFAVCYWAVERARSGQGPVLVEALTYRIGAHTTSDDPRRYQPSEELDEWRGRDPLLRMRRFLEDRGLWNDDMEQQAVEDALAGIDAAIAEAEALPMPSYASYLEVSQ